MSVRLSFRSSLHFTTLKYYTWNIKIVWWKSTYRCKAFDKVWHKGVIYKLKSYGISGNLFKLIENYLTDRKQRIVLSGQNSSSESVLSGSVLGLLLFLIYINDLPDGIQSICKTFADDMSLFSKCHDFKKYEKEWNEDLTIIKNWAYQWKMSLNPDSKKQAIEIFFPRKIVSNNLSPVSFNQFQVKMSKSHKHLGLILDTTLKFNEHLEDKINKCNRIICSMKTLVSSDYL